MAELARTQNRIHLSESESSIADYIKNLGAPTDFNILCGTTVFKAHRALLGASSNYLLELFMKQPEGFFNVIVDGVDAVDVENVLTYVYQAKVGVNSSRTLGFLRAAKQLKIDSLMEQVRTILGGSNHREPNTTLAIKGPIPESKDSDVILDSSPSEELKITSKKPGPTVPQPAATELSTKNPPKPQKSLKNPSSSKPQKSSKNPRGTKHQNPLKKPAKSSVPEIQELTEIKGSVDPKPNKDIQDLLSRSGVIYGPTVSKKSTKESKKLNLSDEDFRSPKPLKAPYPKTPGVTSKVTSKKTQAVHPVNKKTIPKHDEQKPNLNEKSEASIVDEVAPTQPAKRRQKPGDQFRRRKVTSTSTSTDDSEPVSRDLELQERNKGPSESSKISSESSDPISRRPRPVAPSQLAPVANVRGILGRPILSSTKLDSSNPLIPDKFNPSRGNVQKRLGNGDGTPRFFKSRKISDYQGHTYLVPDSDAPIMENKGPLGPKNKPKPQPFCLTDWVNEIENKNEGKPVCVKKVPLKRLKKKLPPKILSTTDENDVPGRRIDKKKRIEAGVVNLVQATDDSTDCVQIIGEMRKKVPLGKRRRVPASTRPLMISNTTGATTSTSIRKSHRIQTTKYAPYGVPYRYPI